MPDSEAEGTLPALHRHPDSEREAGELGRGGGGNPWLLPLLKPLHPQLFPPLQAAGPGREQGLELGQEASPGAAGNTGSGVEGGEQGPGLLFHFFLERERRKNRRQEPPPPGPLGNPPQAGVGSGVPGWLGPTLLYGLGDAQIWQAFEHHWFGYFPLAPALQQAKAKRLNMSVLIPSKDLHAFLSRHLDDHCSHCISYCSPAGTLG